jgi:hypothetical protein
MADFGNQRCFIGNMSEFADVYDLKNRRIERIHYPLYTRRNNNQNHVTSSGDQQCSER